MRRHRGSWLLLVVGLCLFGLRASATRFVPIPSSNSLVASADAILIPAGSEPMRIDGELSEEIWTKAPVINQFVVRDPKEGAQPSHPTEVRVVFDASALYVAVRALDPEPAKVVGMLTRRDDSSPSDRVSILIDCFTIAGRRSSSASTPPA